MVIRLKFCFCDKEECFCLGRTFLGSRQCVGPLVRHFKHFDPPPRIELLTNSKVQSRAVFPNDFNQHNVD